MGSKTDAEVRGEQDRSTRSPRIVERYNPEDGIWHRIEIKADDGWEEMTPEMKNAYLDIVAAISDTFATGTLAKVSN